MTDEGWRSGSAVASFSLRSRRISAFSALNYNLNAEAQRYAENRRALSNSLLRELLS